MKSQGNKPKKDGKGRRNDKQNKGPRRQSFQAEAPKIQIEVPKKNVLAPGIQLTKGETPISVTRQPQVEQAPHIELTKPSQSKIDVVMSPEAVQQAAARKAARTYTIEQLKALRGKNETNDANFFQFHAELQLYRRNLTNKTTKRHTTTRDANANILQHRINSILLRFNINTFRECFTEICALGLGTDTFNLSFVNVVFKHAVLNPQLAALYSLLATNVIYVVHGSKSGDRIRALFLERCNESFVVPKPDADKSLLILQRGIVTFAGHLCRDGIIKDALIDEWTKQLLSAGTPACVRLVCELFLAGGAAIFKAHDAQLKEVTAKAAAIEDAETKEAYTKLSELIASTAPAVAQNQAPKVTLKAPEMKISPSIDTGLSGEYGKLFKRSDSVPVDLSAMGGNDDFEGGLVGAVYAYFYEFDFPKFLRELANLDLPKGQEAALELIRAIMKQPEENQTIVCELVPSLLKEKYFDIAEVKAALKTASHESPADHKLGEILAHIFALLVNSEDALYDEFEYIFADMKGVWREMIPRFLEDIAQLKGSIADDLAESDFFSSLRFLPSATTKDRAHDIILWEIANFFPEYEVVDGIVNAPAGEALDRIHRFEGSESTVVPIVFSAVYDDAERAKALQPLFMKHKATCQKIAADLGEKALELLK